MRPFRLCIPEESHAAPTAGLPVSSTGVLRGKVQAGFGGSQRTGGGGQVDPRSSPTRRSTVAAPALPLTFRVEFASTSFEDQSAEARSRGLTSLSEATGPAFGPHNRMASCSLTPDSSKLKCHFVLLEKGTLCDCTCSSLAAPLCRSPRGNKQISITGAGLFKERPDSLAPGLAAVCLSG